MLQEDQIIYQKIGKLLWSIMPHEAKEIVFSAQLYSNVIQAGSRWFDENNLEHNFYQGWDNPVQQIDDEIVDLLLSLQKLPLFQKDPWTQCQVTLDEQGKFKIEFAYISEEDCWPNMFMKGVSDLTEAELDEPNYVPKEIWEERVRLKNQGS